MIIQWPQNEDTIVNWSVTATVKNARGKDWVRPIIISGPISEFLDGKPENRKVSTPLSNRSAITGKLHSSHCLR